MNITPIVYLNTLIQAVQEGGFISHHLVPDTFLPLAQSLHVDASTSFRFRHEIDLAGKFFYPCRRNAYNMMHRHSSIRPTWSFTEVDAFILPFSTDLFIYDIAIL